jgi:hypothetical protein
MPTENSGALTISEVDNDLDEASSGLLVEPLDVPPLALLYGGVHKYLEEGEAYLLQIHPPIENSDNIFRTKINK